MAMGKDAFRRISPINAPIATDSFDAVEVVGISDLGGDRVAQGTKYRR